MSATATPLAKALVRVRWCRSTLRQRYRWSSGGAYGIRAFKFCQRARLLVLYVAKTPVAEQLQIVGVRPLPGSVIRWRAKGLNVFRTAGKWKHWHRLAHP